MISGTYKLHKTASGAMPLVGRMNHRDTATNKVCVKPRQLGCQHGTARICCRAPCCRAVAAEHPATAAVDKYTLPAWDRQTDRQTYTRPLHRPHAMEAVPTETVQHKNQNILKLSKRVPSTDLLD